LSEQNIFRALRNKNFRYFFVGQMLSVAGTWMQRVAQGWLAYRLTGSSFYLGLVSFAGSAPAFLLAPLGGILADRFDRRRLMVWAQTLALLQAGALAILTLAGVITPASLLFLSVIQGIINAFENPARQSFYTEMVRAEDLSNAIALNASLVNVARVVGPAVAGVLVALWGEGVCFSVNAISFVAVIVALWLMDIEPKPRPLPKTPGLQLLREGFVFVKTKPPLRTMLANFSVFNFAGSPYLTLLPMLAVETLHTGPSGLGWLVSASGAGAIIASLVLASRKSTDGLPSASFAATAMGGSALILLAISHSLPLSILMMSLVGGGYLFTLAGTQTMMQTQVPEEMRGRVMSFYSMVFLGVPPLGSLLAGTAAERYRTPATVVTGGLICLLSALYCARAARGNETHA